MIGTRKRFKEVLEIIAQQMTEEVYVGYVGRVLKAALVTMVRVSAESVHETALDHLQNALEDKDTAFKSWDQNAYVTAKILN